MNQNVIVLLSLFAFKMVVNVLIILPTAISQQDQLAKFYNLKAAIE